MSCGTLGLAALVHEEMVPHEATDPRLQGIGMGRRADKPLSFDTDFGALDF